MSSRHRDRSVEGFRAVNTRNGQRLGPDSVLPVDVVQSPPAPAPYADAANVNVTSVLPTAPSYLTAYANRTPRPTVSNLNPRPGENAANAVQTPVQDVTSEMDLDNQQGTTDLVVDVVGLFSLDTTTTEAPASHHVTGITSRALVVR